MAQGGLAGVCAALFLAACSSTNGASSGHDAGGDHLPGAHDAGSGGSGASGSGGRRIEDGGQNGAGGATGGRTGSSGMGNGGGSVEPPDASTGGGGPVDAGDSGADRGATAEWPLQLPEKGVCTVGGFCWAAPTPLGNSLESVWGSGAADVWFVGHLGTGTIAHWDGLSVRGLTGLVSEWGNVVTGTTSKDVWILGGPDALHYDGAAFSRHAPGTDKELHAAHAVDAKLAYAVGDGGTIVKWNGTSWAPFGSGTTDDLAAVWAFGENDVWVAGTNAYHWNGTAWASAPACVAFWGDAPNDLFCVRAGVALARWDGSKWTDVGAITTTPVRGIWGTGPHDVVVLSRDVTYRYDGTTFAVAASRGGISYSDSYPRSAGLWGSAADAYWAAGPRVDSGPGSLFRFEGTAWAPFGENLAPAGVTCTHQGTAFVGTGIAWTAFYDPSVGNKLARWNGSTYTEYPPGTDKPLLAIDALSAVDVWVTAEDGDVTHWNGTNWTASNVGAKVRLSAVYAASATSVWAGGEAGSIFEYDGQTWTDHSVKTSALTALFGTGPNDVWAVGDTTYHYTTDWDAVDLPKDWPRLVAMWGKDPSNLRGVALSSDAPATCTETCDPSCKGAVVAWDGAHFTVVAEGAPACGDTTRPVFGSFYSSGTSAWATDGRNVYHWDEQAWSREPLPADANDLACGVASDTQQVVAAGPYPLMRRKALKLPAP